MRIPALLTMILIAGCSSPDAPVAGGPVPGSVSRQVDWYPDDDRREHRPLVVLGPGADDPRAVIMRSRVAADRERFDDRDMVWRFVDTSAPDDALLRERFEVGEGDFGVRLVGKDGTVKLASDEPVALEDMFELIDGMPMRQDELRERR